MYYASVSIYQEFIKFLAHTSNMSISCQTITAARAYTQNHSTPAHATEQKLQRLLFVWKQADWLRMKSTWSVYCEFLYVPALAIFHLIIIILFTFGLRRGNTTHNIHTYTVQQWRPEYNFIIMLFGREYPACAGGIFLLFLLSFVARLLVEQNSQQRSAKFVCVLNVNIYCRSNNVCYLWLLFSFLYAKRNPFFSEPLTVCADVKWKHQPTTITVHCFSAAQLVFNS